MTLFAVITQQFLKYLIQLLSYSHKDKYERVWEQTELILGKEVSRKDKTSC